MAINKVIYGGNALMDLTEDTVSAASLLSGTTAHDKRGEPVTGTLVIQHYYTGSGEPSASLGVDGDIYLEVVS